MGIHVLDVAIFAAIVLIGWAVLALLTRSDSVRTDEREEEQ